LSLGLGGQYAYYPQGSGYSMDSFDLGGRIFPIPWGSTPGGEFYLQGGVGLNLQVQPPARGHYHGYAGPGYRLFLQKDLGLDFGVQYDFYSPIASTSHGASAKFGLTFLFGRTEWPKAGERSAGTEIGTESEGNGGFQKPEARMTVEGVYQKNSGVYIFAAGESLQKVSAKVFGNPNFYSLIVDANKALLDNPAMLRAGVELRIPKLPESSDLQDEIIDKSLHNLKYVRVAKAVEKAPYEQVKNWKGPSRYIWKANDDLPSVAEFLYHDEDFYPILVDANEKRLVHPSALRPGVSLVVPPPPAGIWVEIIRQRAWELDNYFWWKTASAPDSPPTKR
jgi:hypothetical protein